MPCQDRLASKHPLLDGWLTALPSFLKRSWQQNASDQMAYLSGKDFQKLSAERPGSAQIFWIWHFDTPKRRHSGRFRRELTGFCRFGVLHDRLDVAVFHGGLLPVAFDDLEGHRHPAVSGATAAARTRTYCQRPTHHIHQFSTTTTLIWLQFVCSQKKPYMHSELVSQPERSRGRRLSR